MANKFVAAAGGWKRWRMDEQEGRLEAARAEAIPADRISVLPDELRQRLLTHLSLKEAIRTGVLARGWRDLWKSRWSDRSSIEIHLRSRDAKQMELDALEREPRPRRRLDRFSLVVDICKFKSTELRRFLDYATECCVEDLHVETRKTTVADKLNFHLPPSSPLLARPSLHGINISSLFYKDAQPFQALEIIRLHSVNISQTTVAKMLALCPNLLTLDLRDCDSDDFFYLNKCLVYPPKLRNVTVVECEGHVFLDLVALPNLRSFRYSCCDRSFSLPKDVALADLYICLDDLLSGNWDISLFNMCLPNDLSGLTVLTICSNVLMGASSSWHDEQGPLVKKFLSSRKQQHVGSSSFDDGSTAKNPKLCNLQSLRELQLLIQNTSVDNLSNIYMFIKTCQCPNLERNFVQLTTSNSVLMSAPIEEPSECTLDNLKIVKIVHFNWRRIEVHLVSFLLRKVSSLHKLLLVSPNVAPLDMPGVQEADLLLLKEAISNGRITLSEAEDDAIRVESRHFGS